MAGRLSRRLARLRDSLGTAGAVAVWLVHVAVVWAWHVPALYEAAMREPALHALEHASMLMTGWAFWALVLRPRVRGTLGTAGAVLYLFAAAAQSTALGALLTLATRASYPSHGASTATWGLTPLDDQQLAGLVMWIFGGIGYVVAALMLLARALRADADRPRRDVVVAARP